MSMGSEGASGAAGAASGAGSAASGAGAAAGAASTAGSAGSSFGSVGTGMDSFNVSQGAQGFDFGAATNSPSASVGPTVGGYTGAMNEPSWLDKALDYYKDYQKGGDQDLSEFTKNFGNNAKTYGFAGRKISDFALSGGKGGNSPPAMVTNVNYQQPENSYFARRRRA